MLLDTSYGSVLGHDVQAPGPDRSAARADLRPEQLASRPRPRWPAGPDRGAGPAGAWPKPRTADDRGRETFAETFQRVFQASMRLDLLDPAVRAQVLAGQRIRP